MADGLKALYERLASLNQFIDSDLITYNGKPNNTLGNGLIYPLSGCFIAPLCEQGNIQLRLKTTEFLRLLIV